jgi:hypothetical protein
MSFAQGGSQRNALIQQLKLEVIPSQYFLSTGPFPSRCGTMEVGNYIVVLFKVMLVSHVLVTCRRGLDW